jgi:hypothetical protein
MSYQDGMAAINLIMPDRVPRTEYSADTYWDLVSKVTGIKVDFNSPFEIQTKARCSFLKEWNYDFFWSTLPHNQIFADYRTKMGHAVYSSGGIDYNDERSCPFHEPDEVLKFDPWQVYGQKDYKTLVKDFEEHYRILEITYNDLVNTTGIYVTCISGLIEIFVLFIDPTVKLFRLFWLIHPGYPWIYLLASM